MLKGDAEFWWKGVKGLLDGDGVQISWNRFKTCFYEKYFPQSVRDAKEQEFLNLRQGGMTLADYTAKFENLCKFSSIYKRNPDEPWKCLRYQSGLRGEVKAAIAPMEIRSFSTMVNKCRVIEDCNRQVAQERSEVYKKRQATQGPQSQQPHAKEPRYGEGFEGKQAQSRTPKP